MCPYEQVEIIRINARDRRKVKRIYLLGTPTWPRPMIPHNACPWGNKYTTYKLHQASLPDYTPQTSFRHISYWGTQSPCPDLNVLSAVKGENLCWPQFDPGVFHAFSMPYVMGKTSPRKWSILTWEAQPCQPPWTHQNLFKSLVSIRIMLCWTKHELTRLTTCQPCLQDRIRTEKERSSRKAAALVNVTLEGIKSRRPDREEDTISHNHPHDPKRKQVQIPIPWLWGIRLETSGKCILYFKWHFTSNYVEITIAILDHPSTTSHAIWSTSARIICNMSRY